MEIDFFEASSKAGGRLSCFKWDLKSGESFLCDNGQHFVIGAYQNFLAMLKMCGALDKWNIFNFEWSGFYLDKNGLSQTLHFKLKQVPFLYPLNLYYPQVYKAPRFFLFKFLYALTFFMREKNKAEGLKNLYENRLINNELIELFFKPFTENCLNTEFEKASNNMLSFLLKECSKNLPSSLDIYLPKSNYHVCVILPIINYLENLGVTFHFNSPVERIYPDRSLKLRKNVTGQYDDIVIATPGYSAFSIWKKSNLPINDEISVWEKQVYRDILNLWVFIPLSKVNTSRTKNSFLWHPVKFEDDGTTYIIVSKELPNHILLAIVRSACVAERAKKEKEEIMAFGRKLLRTKFYIQLDRCDFKLIRSKKATVACTHDQHKTNSIWSGIKTPMDRILKCSDEGAMGFPSTIEGAVFSGNKVAEKLLQQRN